MEAVFWSVEDKPAENCLERLQSLCHQMDSSGGLIKAIAGIGQGKLAFVTFWKSWDNVSRYLANAKSDILPKLGSPHHFEIIWQFPKEETSASLTGNHLALYDVYAEKTSAEVLLEHLRTGAARLSHEAGFQSAAIWIDRNDAEHMLFAAHWSSTESVGVERLESCLQLESDKIPVRDKCVSMYRVQALSPAARSVLA